MSFTRTERFKRAYKKLSPDQQKKIKAALVKMDQNINHPSLRVKRIRGTENIWEASASMGLRITFNRQEEVIHLRNCGEHDRTLQKP
ncbi:MAG: hypothetical protein ACQES4_08315 [Bacillota bacterium]